MLFSNLFGEETNNDMRNLVGNVRIYIIALVPSSFTLSPAQWKLFWKSPIQLSARTVWYMAINFKFLPSPSFIIKFLYNTPHLVVLFVQHLLWKIFSLIHLNS